MNQLIKQFYEFEGQREAVKAFMIECLKEMAVEQVFNKKAIAGIYEGKKAIEKCFDKLDDMFGKKEDNIISNSR